MTAAGSLDDVGLPRIVVEFQPTDADSARFLRDSFAQEELLEADAFTGIKTIAIVVVATRAAISTLLAFFTLHRQRFKDAVVKIGKDEVSLKGYSSEEVLALLDSPRFQKLLRELKSK